MTVLAGATVLAIALVHIFAGELRLEGMPRSHWLSAAAGTSVAFVFVYILPDLAQHQTVFADGGYLRYDVYLAAMIGLIAFYGIERAARLHTGQGHFEEPQEEGDKDADELMGEEDEEDVDAVEGFFWIHLISFGLYNTLTGYLLLRRSGPGPWNLILFGLALALQTVISDYALRDHYEDAQHRIGRWVLAATVLMGYLLALVLPAGEHVTAILFGLLSGAIVLNVLKEELPKERKSRFWAFAVGAIGYAALLLAIVD